MRNIITYGIPIIINVIAATVIQYLPEGKFSIGILSIAIPLTCYCSGLWVSSRLTEDIKREKILK